MGAGVRRDALLRAETMFCAPPEALRAQLLEEAVSALRRRSPEYSAARPILPEQVAMLAGAGLYGAGWLMAAPVAAAAVLGAAAALGFATLIVFRLFAVAAALRRTPQARAPSPVSEQDLPIYSVLTPLYREAGMAAGLVWALEALDYPPDRLDVKLVVEEDDAETLAAVRACAPARFQIIVVPPGGPRTKPKALTYALTFARGDLVTIYDAEDRPDPGQLRAAAAAFAAGGADLVCVQAPLTFYNARENWLTRCFQLEYAIHFRIVLPALLRLGAPIPLGGTSNHFRADALRACGGWDPYNVTEDADLGFRLAAHGGRFAMIDPPTLEEATCTLWAWIRQRSRWLKGYAQTVLVHTRPNTRRFNPAKAMAMWLTLGGTLAAALLHAPALAWLAAASMAGGGAGPAAFALAGAGYASVLVAALSAVRLTGDRSLMQAALLTPFYWPLQTLAAAMALRQLASAPFRWEKTAHGVSRFARPGPRTARRRVVHAPAAAMAAE